jgi:hypothetical protein
MFTVTDIHEELAAPFPYFGVVSGYMACMWNACLLEYRSRTRCCSIAAARNTIA